MAAAAALTDSRTASDPDIRNPYTERVFRIPAPIAAEHAAGRGPYVGSGGHKLTTVADWNLRLLRGDRLYPNSGIVTAKTSQGNSSDEALQVRLDRRFAHGFQLAASYTWSKFIDSTSEGVAIKTSSSPTA